MHGLSTIKLLNEIAYQNQPEVIKAQLEAAEARIREEGSDLDRALREHQDTNG